jgi:hypothetical protein
MARHNKPNVDNGPINTLLEDHEHSTARQRRPDRRTEERRPTKHLLSTAPDAHLARVESTSVTQTLTSHLLGTAFRTPPATAPGCFRADSAGCRTSRKQAEHHG